MKARIKSKARITSTLLAFSLVGLLVGCGSRYIQSPVVDPEAEIVETDATAEIVGLMERYAVALEALNIEEIGALVSPSYYENGGTTHTTEDDYGYDGLIALFDSLRDHVRDLRVTIAVREINWRDDRADVLFSYDYTMLYQVAGSDHWNTERDINRIELRREQGIWRIVSGL